jgi:membrane protein DedA with SNARE-associated domain
VPVLSVLSGITDAVTTVVGDYGLYAIFLLMLVDAVFPAASEPVMVYGGALAAGAFADQDVVFLGTEIESGFPAYAAIATAGTVGYVLGSLAGWAIGRYGGRPFVERRGRWVHMSSEKLDKAERWFARWGGALVLLGRITPVVRSFVAIPAGIARMPVPRYTALTVPGSAAWCFGLAGIGWALGANWEEFHHAFHYADYAVAAGIVAVIAYAVLRWRRGVARRRGIAEPPPAQRGGTARSPEN